MHFSNLAKDHSPELDAQITAELQLAGIEAHTLPYVPTNTEVKTLVRGTVGPWIFTRHWSYWSAKGPSIPTTAALELFQDHSATVRANGHAGSPSPLELYQGFGVTSYHIDDPEGLKALADVIKRIATIPKPCQFSELAIGARFTYPEGSKVWVKLDRHGIAEWSPKYATATWVGQAVGVFSTPEAHASEVIYLG
jgi:hypothetical protein